MTVSRAATRVVVLLCALTIVSYVDRSIVSLLVEPIRHDLRISDVQIGLLSGLAFILLYSVAGVPIARFADRGSRRLLIGGGALLWGLMTMLSGFAESFEMLLFCRLGVGLGEAALIPAAMSIFADIYPPERRAAPVALFFGCSILGSAVSYALGGGALHLAETIGTPGDMHAWQMTFILVGAPAVILALLFLVLVREPARTANGPAPEGAGEGSALRHFIRERRLFGRYFLGISLFQINLFGLSFWTVPFLTRVHGLAPAEAGFAFSASAGVGAVIGAFSVPYLASRMVAASQARNIPTLVSTLMITSLPFIAVAMLASSLWAVLAGLAIAHLLTVGLFTTSQILAQNYAPPRFRAQFIAYYLLFSHVIGAGVGGVAVPWISSTFLGGSTMIGYAVLVCAVVVTPFAVMLLFAARPAIAEAARGDGG